MPRGCRRDGPVGDARRFELISSSVMTAAVRRRLKRIDPLADLCDGEGTPGCLRNRGFEMECENGVCSNRMVQRGSFVPTEAHWFDGKGWGLRLKVDGRKDELVEQYVGEVLEPDEFWARFSNTPAGESMYFVEFVHGLIIDARLKGSYARLVNHACEPNAAFRQHSVKGSRHVVVALLRDVKAGEEVTVAYRDPVTSRQWKCKCGSEKCTSLGGIERVVRSSGVSVPSADGDDDVVILDGDGRC
mmetsp:Transcript_62462/g.129723  ORF Transcript_62462/g.129723 Transcript_62462/m.129723 type:complete len:245 (-) Transcript_62462:79-813(-)